MKELGKRRKGVFDTELRSVWYDPNDPLEFVAVSYQRAISKTHVNKIVKYLENEKKEGRTPIFSEPIVANVRQSGKMALLDGYHRVEALKKFNDRVQVKLELYHGLTHEQEKRIYTDYNIGKRHTTLDLVRPDVYKTNALKIVMEESFIPVTVYLNKKKGMPITNLISCYFSVQKAMSRIGSISTQEYIFEHFNVVDARKLVNFTEWYVGVVGEYSHKSDFYHKSFLQVVMYIYWNTMRPDVLETRLQNFTFDAEMRQILNSVSGFTGFNLVLPAVRDRINKGLKRPII